MNRIEIKELFNNLQNQMLAKLKTVRMNPHPGLKGDATEINWIEWMREYLPQRYKVDKAQIIDYKGNVSDQIDAVIYDRQYSPLVFSQDGIKYIPAESIYAVFEIKQELNKVNVDYAAEKAESVRSLERTSTTIYHAGGREEPKKPFSILAGVLSSRCSWSDGLNGHTFKDNLLSYKANKVIDIGCCLGIGSFVRKDDEIYVSTPDESLIYFFIQLHEMLRSKATVPAIDILKYAESLDSI